MDSVTRFGEIRPLFHIFKNFWKYIKGLFGFGHNLYAIGHIFIVKNGLLVKTQFGHLVTLFME